MVDLNTKSWLFESHREQGYFKLLNSSSNNQLRRGGPSYSGLQVKTLPELEKMVLATTLVVIATSAKSCIVPATLRGGASG